MEKLMAHSIPRFWGAVFTAVYAKKKTTKANKI
jgi:hypothetical protein